MPKTSKEYVSLKYAHKFQNIEYSGIIPFVYIGKEVIHRYMQCEVSIIVYMARIANQRKVSKWLPFKNRSIWTRAHLAFWHIIS